MTSPARETLPDGVLLAFYGDDFTGSTDAMEVMTFAGLPTVLFLEPPSPAQLSGFAHYRGIGIAGTARSRSPAWMDEHLPPIYRTLAGLDPPILQYKVCSTFDSSPRIGSIGRAIDLALAATNRPWCAMVVAAPRLRRYQAFGNLFARVDGTGYRLDRHPTMARHPVTPMAEADLRLHVGRQTARRIGLVDFVALQDGRDGEVLEALRADGIDTILFDVLDEKTLAAVGAVIWQHRGEGLFAASSSGLQYALVAHWRRCGLLAAPSPPEARPAVERLLVVSGSCSPVTGGQIDWAVRHGFVPVRLSGTDAADPATSKGAVAAAIAEASSALEAGRDVIVFSAKGADDPAIGLLRDAATAAGESLDEAQRRVAQALGVVLADLVRRTGLKRVVVAGGDTSGYAAGQLGLFALEAIMPLDPGSPLCLGHSSDSGNAGMEIALKGGQIGGLDYFGRVKSGRPA